MNLFTYKTMPTSPSVNTEKTRDSVPLLLALIAAGLAGNYFKFQLFLNIDFLFGSIFALLALQFCGLGRGILAAAMIAGYTYFIWNHPYAILIMTAEVAVVGWLVRRRKIAMIMADTFYWLIIGMPLVYLFYHGIMQIPHSNTSIVMIKQAMNGIANALIARLLFTAYSLRSRSVLMSYKDIGYHLLGFFVLCPALMLLAIGSRTDFKQIDGDIRTGLLRDSESIGNKVEVWLESRQAAIINLAEMAASRTPQEMQPFVELTKKSDGNFLRVGLLDRTAVTTAYFPVTDEQGESTLGIQGADRPYLAALKKSLKPMLSGLLMGRIGVPQPRIFVLAPVVVHGEFAGYTIGVLSLEQIGDRLKNSTDNTTIFYTLLDKDNKVIMSNRPDQTIMTSFGRSNGTLNHLDAEIHQWVPFVPRNTSIMERWRDTNYVVETTVGMLAEWKLILEQPVAPFQKKLYDNYTNKLTLLFLIFLGALMLAGVTSRRSTSTLEKLGLLTHHLPKKLATDGADIPWPESGFAETKHLIDDFQEMAASLSAQFKEVRQLNASLEQRVVEATAGLRAGEEKYRSAYNLLRLMCDNVPDMIWAKDLEKRYVFANKAICANLLGAADTSEPIGKMDMFFAERERRQHADNPEWHTFGEICRDTDAITMEAGTAQQFDEYGNVQGKFLFLDVHKAPFIDETGRIIGTVGSARDVTTAKDIAKNLKESEDRYRLLFESSLDAILLTAPDSRIFAANAAACRMFAQSEEELQQSGRSGIMDASDPRLVLALEQRSRTGKFTGELTCLRRGGVKFPVELSSAVYQDKNGNIKSCITIRDITERKQTEDALQESLAEKEVLLREVHHRVKNNMAAIIGLFNLQRQAMEDPQVQAVLADLSSRVRAMSLVHEKLYRSESLAKIDFQDYLQSLISHLRTSFGSPHIECEIAAFGVEMPLDLAVPCGMIINELVTNALKHAFPKNFTRLDEKVGTVTVAVHRDHDTFSLCVADNGVGLPPGFDLNTAGTLGLVLVRMLGGHQLGGVYEIEQLGGTRVTLKFSLRKGSKTHE
jgi:PAS domain S-box-containing protein